MEKIHIESELEWLNNQIKNIQEFLKYSVPKDDVSKGQLETATFFLKIFLERNKQLVERIKTKHKSKQEKNVVRFYIRNNEQGICNDCCYNTNNNCTSEYKCKDGKKWIKKQMYKE